jgi:hypothetical protein
MTITNPIAQVNFSSASSASQVSNSLSTTQSVLCAANSNRRGLTIFNTSSSTIFIDYSNTVTTSDYAFSLVAGAFYEMPMPIYTGALHAILSSGTASIEVREFS